MTNAKAYRTAEEIRYKTAAGSHEMYVDGVLIPKGATCIPTGEPSGDFWVTDWPGIDWSWRYHVDTYGVRVKASQVEETSHA